MVRLPQASPETCLICKTSRLLCGRSRCPLLEKWGALSFMKEIKLGEELRGSSPPSLFVGRKGYPDVLAGPLLPPLSLGRETLILEEPELWYGTSLNQIVKYRSVLVRSSKRTNVRSLENPLIQSYHEFTMASRPVELEVKFQKPPRATIQFDVSSQPWGPIGRTKDVRIVENPSTIRSIEKAYYDGDLKANNAMEELYRSGVTVNQIQRVLSAGMLGLTRNRRLVPTRWSITATDDAIGKKLRSRVKEYTEIGNYEVFQSHYLDNHFYILLVPSSWMFEQIEAWYPGSAFVPGSQSAIVSDHEFGMGRKGYANKTAGAYYAARLASLEHLTKVRRQAAVIVFREVRSGYLVPLGVWQIRENVRHAFKEKQAKFSSLQEALRFIKSGLRIPIEEWTRQSKIIDRIIHQRTLLTYLSKLGDKE